MTDTGTTPRSYKRFDTFQRVEHLVLLISFTILAITGLPQRYATTGWAEFLIRLFGGIEMTRIIHRVSSIVMMLVALAHVIEVAYRLIVQRRRPFMLPTLSDVTDAWKALLHNIGLRKDHPVIGRFGFEEKMEYWAVVWGTLVMMITGFMMWNPITTTRFLPGEFIPAAKAAHGGEALLAVLAIILWHFYNVHFKRFNRSIFTGELSEEEMAEYHPQALADLKAGRGPAQPDRATRRPRERIFIPVASVLAIVWLGGLYLFATFEQTAITTVPRQDVVAFVPVTPTPAPSIPPTAEPLSTPTPAAESEPVTETADVSWTGSIQPLLTERCGACHGELGGLALTDYESTLAGGANSPAILPGDAEGSLLVEIQAAGGHPGQFDDSELDLVRQWIDAGATNDAAEAAVTWSEAIEPLLTERCGACHGELGGLTLTDYESTLAGGANGAAILPGDAEGSLLVEIQAAGGHPGQFDDSELNLVRQWIDAGALNE